MAAALRLLQLGRSDVRLHLFDTFEGMTTPTEEDWSITSGFFASELLDGATPSSKLIGVAAMGEVLANMRRTGYQMRFVHLVKGKVEETIPAFAPPKIAVLRLDTDWYASTKHELIHLYPRLSPGGVLIIDDYGYWAGARKAVEEYLQETSTRLLLTRIDNTGRIGVKTHFPGIE